MSINNVASPSRRALIAAAATTSVLPAITVASPFSKFQSDTPPPPSRGDREKSDAIEFAKGFGKGFTTVLCMSPRGAALTLGSAAVGIAFPATVPFITLGVVGIACYQGKNAISKNDWQKIAQSSFALLSPLMGGAWIRKTFATDCRQLAVYALKNASEPDKPSNNIIIRWFQDSKASSRDVCRLLAGETLYNLQDPQKALTIYQIAPKHFKDVLQLGFLKKRTQEAPSKEATFWERTIPQRHRPVILEMLGVAFTPGGPPNGFGMEQSLSTQEQQEQTKKSGG